MSVACQIGYAKGPAFNKVSSTSDSSLAFLETASRVIAYLIHCRCTTRTLRYRHHSIQVRFLPEFEQHPEEGGDHEDRETPVIVAGHRLGSFCVSLRMTSATFSHPKLPAHKSEWVMWVRNVSSDMTPHDLCAFFNQPLLTHLEFARSRGLVTHLLDRTVELRFR